MVPTLQPILMYMATLDEHQRRAVEQREQRYSERALHYFKCLYQEAQATFASEFPG